MSEVAHHRILAPWCADRNGIFSDHVSTPYNNPSDIDNTFFLTLFNPPPAALVSRITTNGSIYFRINPDGDDDETFRFDAANLEIEYTPAGGTSTGQTVPEPASLLLFATGLIAVVRASRGRLG